MLLYTLVVHITILRRFKPIFSILIFFYKKISTLYFIKLQVHELIHELVGNRSISTDLSFNKGLQRYQNLESISTIRFLENLTNYHQKSAQKYL